MRAGLLFSALLFVSACATSAPRVSLDQAFGAPKPMPVVAHRVAPAPVPKPIPVRLVEPAEFDADLAAFLETGRTERALWRPGMPVAPARIAAWEALLPEVRGLLTRPERQLSTSRLEHVEAALGSELSADQATYGTFPSEVASAVGNLRSELGSQIQALKRAAMIRAKSPPRFIWPVTPVHVTSRFGRRRHPILGIVRMHCGVDLRAAPGQIVHAAEDGVVIWAGRDGGYGLLVKIQHRQDWETRYAHLSAILVSAHDVVRRGDPIGFVGSTGLATGPHLHFEVRHRGRPENPLRVLRAKPRRHLRHRLISRASTSGPTRKGRSGLAIVANRSALEIAP